MLVTTATPVYIIPLKLKYGKTNGNRSFDPKNQMLSNGNPARRSLARFQSTGEPALCIHRLRDVSAASGAESPERPDTGRRAALPRLIDLVDSTQTYWSNGSELPRLPPCRWLGTM
jgi:hypothetical protein